MRTTLLVIGFVLLFGAEILRVYFIMPFPGSQQKDSIGIAYWLHNNIVWIRLFALALIAFSLVRLFKFFNRWKKGIIIGLLALYAVIFFMFNFRLQADKMFYQPGNKQLAAVSDNKVLPNKLVIGVAINGEAKAYPVQVIGYHHQVRDTVGNTPVMITYCTVCRTGRVYSPEVNGQSENFRLVGMDHFNAMFEDNRTKSWWQQATGVAIAGPLKGTVLKEIPAQQMTLAAWLQRYPATTIMQPDTTFKKEYAELELFDNGIIKSGLEKRDSGSWQKKSWVVGINHNQTAKAYDWNVLTKEGIIQDSLPGLPVVVALANDSISYFAWNRNVEGNILHFTKMPKPNFLKDAHTGSLWNETGVCVSGALKGKQLQPVQAYQEFWHSWQQFHPNTIAYKKP